MVADPIRAIRNGRLTAAPWDPRPFAPWLNPAKSCPFAATTFIEPTFVAVQERGSAICSLTFHEFCTIVAGSDPAVNRLEAFSRDPIFLSRAFVHEEKDDDQHR